MKRYKVEYGMLVDTKENEILEHPYHSEYVDADIAEELYDMLEEISDWYGLPPYYQNKLEDKLEKADRD